MTYPKPPTHNLTTNPPQPIDNKKTAPNNLITNTHKTRKERKSKKQTKQINILVEDINKLAIIPVSVYTTYHKRLKRSFYQAQIHIPKRLNPSKRELYLIVPTKNLVVKEQKLSKKLDKIYQHAEKKTGRLTRKVISDEPNRDSKGNLIKPKSWRAINP